MELSRKALHQTSLFLSKAGLESTQLNDQQKSMLVAVEDTTLYDKHVTPSSLVGDSLIPPLQRLLDIVILGKIV